MAGVIAGIVYWDPLQRTWLQLKTPGFASANPVVNVGWEFAWAVTWANMDDSHPVKGHLDCKVTRPDGSQATVSYRPDYMGNDFQDWVLPWHTGWIDPDTGLERILTNVTLGWSFIPDVAGQYQLTVTLTNIS